jgi:adenylate cyclase
MDARLERKLRSLAVLVAAGVTAGIVFVVAQGRTSSTNFVVGASYGLLMSASLGATELLVLQGPMRQWLGGLSFATSLIVRSTIYVAIIVVIQWLELGEVIVGVSPDTSSKAFWSSIIYSAVLSVVMNLALGIANIIGPRAFLNFFIGRYHSPVEEKRFVLFVDIAGSTGLAERLGSSVTSSAPSFSTATS